MDAMQFNADEIYEMAEDIEEHGFRFYETAREAARDAGTRDLLARLADMERRHKATFARMREELPERDRRAGTSLSPEEAEEKGAYLRTLADSRVFGKAEAMALSGSQEGDLLDRALDLEKDTIVFLLELKEMVAPIRGKDDLDVIIREELGHIRMINAWIRNVE